MATSGRKWTGSGTGQRQLWARAHNWVTQGQVGFGTGKLQAKHVGRGLLNSQRHSELVVNSPGRDQGSGINSSIKLSAQCSMCGNGQNTAFNLDIEDYLGTHNEIPKISCTWGRENRAGSVTRRKPRMSAWLRFLWKGLPGCHNLPETPSGCCKDRHKPHSASSA